MKTLRYYKIFIALFLVTYTAVAIYGNVYAERKEIFPVFSWSLFSYVSDRAKQIELEILEIDHAALAAPVYFYALRDEFCAAQKRDVTLSKLLERLAAALRSGNVKATESLRRVLERTYLTGHRQVRYRIVLAKFHPIERWRNGTVRSKQELGRFEVLYE